MPADTSKLPGEFRSHLYPMPADVLHNLVQTFVFMPASELDAECEAISEALPRGEKAALPTLEAAVQLGHRFAQLAPYGEPPGADTLRQSLAPLSPLQSGALAARLEQIRRGIRQVQRTQGSDYDATQVLAVPPLWHLRWEHLIHGALHPAYVAMLDVSRL